LKDNRPQSEGGRKAQIWRVISSLLSKKSINICIATMHYDNIADQYDKYGKEAITDWVLGYKNVLELLGQVRDKKILDYGAGTGRFSRVLKDKGAEVTGVDVSIKQLDIARSSNPDIAFYQDTDNELRSFNNFFDFVVLNFVLCTIAHKENLVSVLKTIQNMLKPEGVLVLLTSNVEKSKGKQFMTFAIEDVRTPTSGSPIKIYLGGDKSLVIEDYYWTERDYRDFLSEGGFEIIEVLEPVADDINHSWKDETTSPPFLIIKAKKKEK
jgi:2-polyprenyl-3-methyl-5-hydroxy-6-metoxy-1,4-benzoquinol methylase